MDLKDLDSVLLRNGLSQGDNLKAYVGVLDFKENLSRIMQDRGIFLKNMTRVRGGETIGKDKQTIPWERKLS